MFPGAIMYVPNVQISFIYIYYNEANIPYHDVLLTTGVKCISSTEMPSFVVSESVINL